jgi:MtN3 and saliva related transmembrane protein
MWVEAIGWFGAAILLLTLGRQVYTQWREGRTQGVSKWLFIGQLTASTAFLIYSWLVENWVFVATNGLLLLTAAVGECIYIRNRKREEARGAKGQAEPEPTMAPRT